VKEVEAKRLDLKSEHFDFISIKGLFCIVKVYLLSIIVSSNSSENEIGDTI
jgi:hypothetical protein